MAYADFASWEVCLFRTERCTVVVAVITDSFLIPRIEVNYNWASPLAPSP